MNVARQVSLSRKLELHASCVFVTPKHSDTTVLFENHSAVTARWNLTGTFKQSYIEPWSHLEPTMRTFLNAPCKSLQQSKGTFTWKSDIWATGIISYVILTLGVNSQNIPFNTFVKLGHVGSVLNIDGATKRTVDFLDGVLQINWKAQE